MNFVVTNWIIAICSILLGSSLIFLSIFWFKKWSKQNTTQKHEIRTEQNSITKTDNTINNQIVPSNLQSYKKTALDYAFEQWKKADINPVINKINLIADGQKYTPQSFFNYYHSYYGNLKQWDYSGVYVIQNLHNQYYYVGQSKQMLKRVNNHLTGKGNGNLYADYKYGAQLEITLIKVSNDRLNEVERLLIDRLQATTKGYNRTKGNQ